jgi:hypothetical protein
MSTKPTSDPCGQVGSQDLTRAQDPSSTVLGDIAETPDLQGAYPRLSDAQIAALADGGNAMP